LCGGAGVHGALGLEEEVEVAFGLLDGFAECVDVLQEGDVGGEEGVFAGGVGGAQLGENAGAGVVRPADEVDGWVGAVPDKSAKGIETYS